MQPRHIAFFRDGQQPFQRLVMALQRVDCLGLLAAFVNCHNRHPSLHLKGDWLKEAGFGTDTPVTIAVERGQLVIRTLAE